MSTDVRPSPNTLLARFLSGEPPANADEVEALEHAIRTQSWEGIIEHKHAARDAAQRPVGTSERKRGRTFASTRRWWFVGKVAGT